MENTKLVKRSTADEHSAIDNTLDKETAAVDTRLQASTGNSGKDPAQKATKTPLTRQEKNLETANVQITTALRHLDDFANLAELDDCRRFIEHLRRTEPDQDVLLVDVFQNEQQVGELYCQFRPPYRCHRLSSEALVERDAARAKGKTTYKAQYVFSITKDGPAEALHWFVHSQAPRSELKFALDYTAAYEKR
jgi:hypothetical protein